MSDERNLTRPLPDGAVEVMSTDEFYAWIGETLEQALDAEDSGA